jgi:cyclase
MFRRLAIPGLVLAGFVVAILVAQEKPKDPVVPAMKFNDVVEIAPNVFFRYSSISATDMTVPFGGSNNIWIVFQDYVVVVDANFPKEAADVIADIRKTTKKPIKYVLDTHHHGDHAYGNSVWAKEGAQIVAHSTAARLLKTSGPKQWEQESKSREDIKNSSLKLADITFDDKYVLEDATMRVEFLHFGHSHTPGDAVAYLPKQKILCTGDACVNGAFNYMGHANSGSWVKALEGMQKLEVNLVAPGHGSVTGKDLLAKQKRYFAELRENVQAGIDAKKNADDIAKTLEMTWYETWTGKPAKQNGENIQHVYAELTGKIQHDRLGYNPAPLDYIPRDVKVSLPRIITE